MEACREASSGQGMLVWVAPDFLDEHGVEPWSDLPLWVGTQEEEAGFARIDCSKAIGHGLTFRPLSETIADTLAWARSRPTDFFSFTGLLTGTTQTVSLTVPGSGVYTVGNLLSARARIFDSATLPGSSLDSGDYLGLATNGEVEDYQWQFSPTAVTLDRLEGGSGADGSSIPLWLLTGGLIALLVIRLETFFSRKRADN